MAETDKTTAMLLDELAALPPRGVGRPRRDGGRQRHDDVSQAWTRYLNRNACSGRDTEDLGVFRDALEAMGSKALEAQARAR
jgi:hypothetical protein